MNVIDLEILIPASPEFIWRFLGDLAALPEWQADVNSVMFLSTQREGSGARWRALSDKNSDTVVEVSAWYDTVGYEYSVRDGAGIGANQGRIRLTEVTDGTLVRWTFQYEHKGMLGGLRNAMRVKRATTNQIQASLRNLHQLIARESGGISTHEAKASVREAPAVGERLVYKPRHPSAFHDPTVGEADESDLTEDTDRKPAIFDFAAAREPLKTVADSDTKPNPVVLAPELDPVQAAQPEPTLDDTQPVVEAEVQPLPPSKPARLELPPAAHMERPLSPDPGDRANMSVFEIFGLQRPSEAKHQPQPASAAASEPGRGDMDAGPPQPSASREPEPALEPPAAPSPMSSATITGLRRKGRRHARIRSHNQA